MPYYSLSWAIGVVKTFASCYPRGWKILCRELWVFTPDVAKWVQADQAAWRSAKELVKKLHEFAVIKGVAHPNALESYTDVRWVQELFTITYAKGPGSALTELMSGSTILKRSLALPDRAELDTQRFLEL